MSKVPSEIAKTYLRTWELAEDVLGAAEYTLAGRTYKVYGEWKDVPRYLLDLDLFESGQLELDQLRPAFPGAGDHPGTVSGDGRL